MSLPTDQKTLTVGEVISSPSHTGAQHDPHPQPKPKILALARNATPPKTQALATADPALDLHVIEGYTPDPDPIFAAHPEIDAAERAGVKRFVFSSVDRGGDECSWENPVPHFAEKCHIEAYLYLACEGGTRWEDLAAGGRLREPLRYDAGRHAAAAREPAGREALRRGGAARSLVSFFPLVMGVGYAEWHSGFKDELTKQ
ncbi:hypothetical protein DL764_004478 [Monosporascus ibericus]|uniref:NmrA-like domain-containing protein n=1 Tax=Monosporascus ibericus TaxID=155417 RepID=A0A4Q4TF72_9PEZI|nr:hypothetical protein DL764_004478 [Monosporascus ibericus]